MPLHSGGTHRYQQPIDNDICIKPVASAIYNRFGKEVTFLYRRHRHSIPGNDNSKLHIVDVTDYPDMQDLLEFADIMITDYSSSIWDFCITRKPAFLYVPDLSKIYGGTRILHPDRPLAISLFHYHRRIVPANK